MITVLTCSAFFPVQAIAAGLPEIILSFDGIPDKRGVPALWELKENAGEADVRVAKSGSERVINMRCADASFSVEREVLINITEYPYLSWRWKAVSLPPSGDLRESSANDQGLQVLIAFEGRRILSYVWDTNAPQGTITDESIGWPISLKIKVLVLKSGLGEADRWVSISRNILKDYRELFGEDPEQLEGVRVQCNTQHTESISDGYTGSIRFRKNPTVD